MIYETPEPCKECPRLRTLADNAEFALATAERERDTLTAALKEALSRAEAAESERDALRREVEEGLGYKRALEKIAFNLTSTGELSLNRDEMYRVAKDALLPRRGRG